MPVVPTYQGAVGYETSGGFRAPTDAPFAGSVAEANRVSEDIQHGSEEMIRAAKVEQQKADNAILSNAEASLGAAKQDLLYDPEKGALAQQGSAVLTSDYIKRYQDEMGKRTADVEKSLRTPEQRAAFQAVANREFTHLSTQIQRHMYVESEKYAEESYKSAVDYYKSDGGANWQDQDYVAQNLDRTIDKTLTYAHQHNKPPEWIQDTLSKNVSAYHTEVIRNMLAADQYEGAQQYYDKIHDKSFPGRLVKGNLDTSKQPTVQNPDGTVSTVRSMSIGVDGREMLIPTVSPDGRVLSDDEAISQFEQTGKHLGVFKDEQSATNYAENLHKAEDLRVYGGLKSPLTGDDEAHVQNMLREGSVTGQAQKISDLVRSKFPSDYGAQVDYVRTHSKDPKVREAAMHEVDAENARDARVTKDASDKNFNDVQDLVEQNVPWSQVPADKKGLLDENQRGKLEKRAYEIANNIPSGTKWETYEYLMELASREPKRAMATNPREFFGDLAPAERKKVSDRWGELYKQDGNLSQDTKVYNAANKAADETMALSGGDPKAKPKTSKGQEAIENRRAVRDAVDDFTKTNGRLPNEKEIQDIADQQRRKVLVPGKLFGTNKVPVSSVSIKDVPKEDYKDIKDQLKLRGMSTADEMILKYYRKSLPNAPE